MPHRQQFCKSYICCFFAIFLIIPQSQPVKQKGPLSKNTESSLGSNPRSKEMNLFFWHTDAVLIGHASHFGYEIPVFFGRF